MNHPALFDAFPALAQRLARAPLLEGPTPLQPLAQASQSLGVEVWVKRDDLSSTVYGGNKPRKLEFILGRALAEGRRELVTMGAMGTNHGLATTIHGQRLGLTTSLELFPQPVTAVVLRNIKLFQHFGARINLSPTMERAFLRFRYWQRLRRPGACFIPAGGSSPLGAVGYVSAGLELAGQLAAGQGPRPQAVFVAAGTLGSQAGLRLGLLLAGQDIPVIGVAVVPLAAANAKAALNLARRTLALLRAADPSVPELTLAAEDFVIDPGQLGPGYGQPTPAALAAMDLLSRQEGLSLEPTYTAKAFAGLCAWAQERPGQGPLLFWHTYNSARLDHLADQVDPAGLPEALRKYFLAQ